MGNIAELIAAFGVGSVVSGVATSLVNNVLYKRKNKAEADAREIENIAKVVGIWEGIANEWKTHAEQLKKQSDELANDIVELKKEISDLRNENAQLRLLVEELKLQTN